jgi:hypothetical protein
MNIRFGHNAPKNHNREEYRLPADFPPAPLVKHYFAAWTREGTLARIHNTLREQVRQVEGRTANPSAALIDSQSLRGAETVPRSSRGYDAGKKVNGRKRHVVTDTCGWLLAVLGPARACRTAMPATC